MAFVFLDFETRSSTPIEYGLTQYFGDKDFGIIVSCYAVNDGPVIKSAANSTDILRTQPELIELLRDPDNTLVAHNAEFEVKAMKEGYGYEHPWSRTICTAAQARAHNLPGNLDMLAKALFTDAAKPANAKALIKRYACPPFEDPALDPVAWSQFVEYCANDVELLRRSFKAMPFLNYPMLKSDREAFAAIRRINDRGIKIDRELAEYGCKLAAETRDSVNQVLCKLTAGRIQTVSQTAALAKLLDMGSLSAEAVEEALEESDSPVRSAILMLRQMAGQSSASKFERLLSMSDSDDRLRGQFVFRGAPHTGRHAGFGVQVHNLPKQVISQINLEHDITMIKAGAPQLCISDPMPLAVSLVRPSLIATEGNQFYDIDWNAIEARLTAWAAEEQWILDVFLEDRDAYVETYTALTGKEAKGKNDRNLGKVTTLAFGFGGGAGALLRGCVQAHLRATEVLPRVEYDIEGKAWLDDLLKRHPKWLVASAEKIKMDWRAVRPATVQAWAAVQDCFLSGEGRAAKMEFFRDGDATVMKLPSGRHLIYWNVKYERGADGMEISALGVYKNGMHRSKLTKGKIFQNGIQAMAVDVLDNTLTRAEKAGLPTVLHIHDQVVVDGTAHNGENLKAIMETSPDWLQPGLLKSELEVRERFAK